MTTKRWAIVSDIHGNLPALEAVLADAHGVDGWLNLGDIVSGPLWPRETAEFVMRQGWPTLAWIPTEGIPANKRAG